MSSSSGYKGATYFQELGPRCFDMSSASGYRGTSTTYFQEFGLRCFDMSAASGYMVAEYVQKFGAMAFQYLPCQSVPYRVVSELCVSACVCAMLYVMATLK